MKLDYTSLTSLYNHYRNVFKPFNGETRESYLEWRKNWKTEYQNISRDIRLLKLARKQGEGRTDLERAYATTFVRYLKGTANYALDLRIESKVKANQNYVNMKKVTSA